MGPRGDGLVTVAPCRAVDTRFPPDSPALAPGETRLLTLAPGACGVPVATDHEVAINITVVAPAGSGFAKVFAGDASAPLTSVITFNAGGTRASNTIVKLASNGTGTIAPVSPTLPAGTEGAPYLQTFTASAGSGTYTFAVTAGSLPAPPRSLSRGPPRTASST